jgi:hypothetical protein
MLKMSRAMTIALPLAFLLALSLNGAWLGRAFGAA